jgi:hypothetical protein
MLKVLELIFSSFWTWLGFLIYLFVILSPFKNSGKKIIEFIQFVKKRITQQDKI